MDIAGSTISTPSGGISSIRAEGTLNAEVDSGAEIGYLTAGEVSGTATITAATNISSIDVEGDLGGTTTAGGGASPGSGLGSGFQAL